MTYDSSPVKKLNVPISELFPIDENYTFLAGAGISIDSPTNMPSAIQMVNDLLTLVSPEEELSSILNLKTLRFELAVEIIQNVVDMDLQFFDYMEHVKSPNLIHHFLSRKIVKGSNVITTNFDYSIEYALKELISEDKQNKIRILITKEDFLEASQKPEILDHTYNLVKIHGSKRNIITQENTQESLVATIGALGRDREEGKTFAIEPYKKDVLYSLLKDTTLVILGYSGNDDFDITPLLSEVPFISRLIWIDHTQQNMLECLRITGNSSEIGKDEDSIIQFLAKLGDNQEFERILIRGNTKGLIKDYLWSIFHTDTPLGIELKEKEYPKLGFNQYIFSLYGNLTNLQKYHFASELYYKLKLIPSAIRCATRGLVTANSINAMTAKSTFFNYLGLTHQIQGDYEKSLNFYSRALIIDEELGNFYSQASLLNNIGSIYSILGEYDKAVARYELSLRISDELGNMHGKITSLNNIGNIYENQTQYKKALNYYSTALEICEQIGDLERKAVLHNNIGKILNSEDPNTAILHYKNALKITKLLGDLQGQNIIINNIGRILAENGDLKTAISMFKTSIEIAERLGDNSKKAGALSNLGSMALANNDTDQALHYFEEASKLEEKQGNPHLVGIYHNNIGMIYQKTNQIHKAIEAYKVALQKFESIDAKSNIALVLSKIGDCYMAHKRFSESLKYYLAAKNIYTSPDIGELENLAAITSNLGKSYEMLGNHEEALRCYEEALEIDEKLEHPINRALDYFNIGRMQKTQNHLPIALDNLRKSLDLFTQLGMKEQVESIKRLLNTL